jgi:predicted ribosome-associated RNA-binding protein Tma20
LFLSFVSGKEFCVKDLGSDFQYPFMLPHERVDKGAIKFVLSGANIMCPGHSSQSP